MVGSRPIPDNHDIRPFNDNFTLDTHYYQQAIMSSKKQQEVPLTSTLIARFLRSNNYTETLRTFIREASLPSDAGQSDGANEWTIERILDEKRVFDETLKFERYADGNEAHDVWSVPGMSFELVFPTPSQLTCAC